MVFIETPLFTDEIQRLLTSDEYRALQLALLFRPDAGVVIPRSGGIRKLRWHLPRSGKRGGLRVIYYWDKPADVLYLLWVYKKSRQEDLTPNQLKILSRLVQEYLA